MFGFYNRIAIAIFPILIASLPVVLHLLDKALEYKFVPFGKEKLRNLMRVDHRSVVQRVGETEANFRAVDTYFDFEKGCHFVSTLLIFNIISLFFAQIEFMNSVTDFNLVSLLLIIGLIISLVVFFKRLADGKLVASTVRATRNWERWAIGALAIVLITELSFHFSKAEGSSAPDSTETTLSAMQKTLSAIEMRLANTGVTLSPLPTTLEGIETRLANFGSTLSLIPKTLEGIHQQLLDMRIAQPVDVSYLTGADCGRVQQALKELGVYKGQVDGKCGGATNAAAREWQIREQRTIAPAWSAEEIERTLRTTPQKRVGTGR